MTALSTPVGDTLISAGGADGWHVSKIRSNPSWHPVAILSVSYITSQHSAKSIQHSATYPVTLTPEKSTLLTICLCLNSNNSLPVLTLQSLALKSPEAVAASVRERRSTLVDQTAPLWPLNEPIQSPVSPFRICGNLSVINRSMRYRQKGHICTQTHICIHADT
jgi:hypothetical protein